ncbi:MAG TPA: PKD domain-containing protein [bacterium]|nr:PKD domain-containing protein [bacterium]
MDPVVDSLVATDAFAPPEREGQGVLGGKVTLNGTVQTPPGGVAPPYAAGTPGNSGDLALVKLRVTTTPTTNRSHRAQFWGEGVAYGAAQISATGALNYLPFYLTAGGRFDLTLFNSLTASSAIYDSAAHWQYQAYVRPAEDPDEPNDDDAGATYADRSRARTRLIDGRLVWSSLYRRDTGTEDLEDWYRLDLLGGRSYRFRFANSNGQWGSWRYHVRLVSDQGFPVASVSTAGTGTTLDYTVQGDSRRAFYLQVTGEPESRRGSSVFFAEYSLGLHQAPRLTGVDQSIAESGLAAAFTPTNLGGAVTAWEWNFGGAGDPATSSLPAPEITLGEPGIYPATVRATGPGGSTNLPFNVTVEPPLKPVGLHVQVIKFDESTWPARFAGLPEWSEEAVRNWFVENANPVFQSVGFKFARDQITLAPIVNPALYIIDTNQELTQLQALCTQGDAAKLNITFVHDIGGGLNGQMMDLSPNCDFDNNQRGCFAKTNYFGGAFPQMRYLICHELGHVIYLPHICTFGCSDPSKYDNVMSYNDSGWVRLWDNIARESATNCYMSQAVQMNQNTEAFNWIDTYLP